MRTCGQKNLHAHLIRHLNEPADTRRGHFQVSPYKAGATKDEYDVAIISRFYVEGNRYLYAADVQLAGNPGTSTRVLG